MLSRYFQTRRLRAAVQHCQLLLAPQLRRAYGAAHTYTLGQITQAMQRAKLPGRLLEFACAAFMDEAAFNAAIANPDHSYQAHRDMLQRHAIPNAASRGFEPAIENSDAISAAANTWLPH